MCRGLYKNHLLFVHCTSTLIMRGNAVTADALLGRFLPRLGAARCKSGGLLSFLGVQLLRIYIDFSRNAILVGETGIFGLPRS